MGHGREPNRGNPERPHSRMHRPCCDDYNPDATQDDGSCVHKPKPGCTDPAAENYNPKATEDDEACEYIEGCTNPEPRITIPKPPKTTDLASCPPSLDLEQSLKMCRKAGDLGDNTARIGPLRKRLAQHRDARRKPDAKMGRDSSAAREKTASGCLEFSKWEICHAERSVGSLGCPWGLLGPIICHPEGFKYRNYLENAYRLGMFPGPPKPRASISSLWICWSARKRLVSKAYNPAI